MLKAKGDNVAMFKFATPQSVLLSDTLLAHANLIATTRRHQKAVKAQAAELGTAGGAALVPYDETPDVFAVTRFVDPSGMLVRDLELRFSQSELQTRAPSFAPRGVVARARAPLPLPPPPFPTPLARLGRSDSLGEA